MSQMKSDCQRQHCPSKANETRGRVQGNVLIAARVAVAQSIKRPFQERRQASVQIRPSSYSSSAMWQAHTLKVRTPCPQISVYAKYKSLVDIVNRLHHNKSYDCRARRPKLLDTLDPRRTKLALTRILLSSAPKIIRLDSCSDLTRDPIQIHRLT